MVDETTKTEQDTPSGGTGQSSGSKGGTTSKGKLYTVTQITKIKSDAAAEAGRLRKAAEQERDTLQQDLQTTKTRLDDLEGQVRESRLAEARGDPAQLTLFQREEAITKRERQVGEKDRDLARREGQLTSDRADVDKDKGVVSIAYIAAKYGLETEKLEALGVSDPEALERVAKELASAKPGGKAPPSGGGDEEGGRLEPDTGEGTGGGAKPLTTESVEGMNIASVEKAMNKAEENK